MIELGFCDENAGQGLTFDDDSYWYYSLHLSKLDVSNGVRLNVVFLVLTADGFRRMFRSSLMIAVAEKTYLKDKEEGSQLKKRKPKKQK